MKAVPVQGEVHLQPGLLLPVQAQRHQGFPQGKHHPFQERQAAPIQGGHLQVRPELHHFLAQAFQARLLHQGLIQVFIPRRKKALLTQLLLAELLIQTKQQFLPIIALHLELLQDTRTRLPAPLQKTPLLR